MAETLALVVCVVAAAAVILALVRGAPSTRDVARHGQGPTGASPARWTADLGAFRDMFPDHVQVAERASADFRAAFLRTFSGGNCLGELRSMFRSRSLALSRLRDARLRLPNSLKLERALVEATEDLDRHMMEHVRDVRGRCGLGHVHPGPLGDAWYARWYRASNDVLA